MRKVILFLWFLIHLSPLCSQEIKHERISERFNFDRNEIYRLLIDQKGYLWVTTNTGVFRFDGHSFEEIGKNSSLSRSICFSIIEDNSGIIWMLNDRGEIYQYKNEKLQFYHKVRREDVLSSKDNALGIDTEGNLYLSGNKKGYLSKIDTNKRRSVIVKNNADILLYKFQDEYVVVNNFPGDHNGNLREEKVNNGEVLLSVESPDSLLLYKLKMAKKLSNENKFEHVFSPLKKGRIAIYTNELLYILESDFSIRSLEGIHKINNVYEDSKGRFWVSILEGGLLCFDKDLELLEYDLSFLDNKTVTSVIEDDHGGIWFGTYTDGLFYCNNLIFLGLQNEKRKRNEWSNLCKVNDSTLILGNNDGKVLAINNKLNIVNEWDAQFNETGRHYIKVITYDSLENCIWVINTVNIYTQSLEDGRVELKNDSTNMFGNDLLLYNDSILYINKEGICVYKIAKHINRYGYLNKVYQNFYDAEYVFGKEVWIGATNGLYVLSGNKLKEVYREFAELNQGIVKIKESGNTVWLLNEDGQVMVLENNQLTVLDEKNNIGSDKVTSVYVYNDSTLFLGGTNNLYRINTKRQPYEAAKYSVPDGLPKGQILDISSLGTTLILNIGKQIWKVNLKELEKVQDHYPIYITKVELNGAEMSNLSELKYVYSAEDIVKIQFRSLNFRNLGRVSYRYKLKGKVDQWIEVGNPEVVFAGLGPGKYQFEVQSKETEVRWGSSAVFIIEVDPKFWQTYWFKIVLGIVVLGGCYWFVINRIKINKRKESIKTEIAELELKALKAQINPHFIFNSISSIQFYLSKNKPEKAAEYMQDFADLIRKVLNQSDNNLVSLESELKVIENYVKLESRKFRDDDLQLNCSISDQVSPREIQLPPTIIQPFVENAIWHGLKHKQGEKRIDILVSVQGDQLKICIEDNGVGRDKAKMFTKNNNRKSYGMTITANRIAVLNNTDGEHFKIEDLYTNGVPSGTRITLLLPFINTEMRTLL